MFLKKINILLIPDKTQRVRQLRVSWVLLAFFSFLVISWAVCLCWIAGNYLQIRSQISQLVQLEKEDMLWQKRFLSLAQQSDEMNKQMERFSDKSVVGIAHLSNSTGNQIYGSPRVNPP